MQKNLFSSSSAERNFGSRCLILKQTPPEVLFGITTVIKSLSIISSFIMHVKVLFLGQQRPEAFSITWHIEG